jgi:hypothetical protein
MSAEDVRVAPASASHSGNLLRTVGPHTDAWPWLRGHQIVSRADCWVRSGSGGAARGHLPTFAPVIAGGECERRVDRRTDFVLLDIDRHGGRPLRRCFGRTVKRRGLWLRHCALRCISESLRAAHAVLAIGPGPSLGVEDSRAAAMPEEPATCSSL